MTSSEKLAKLLPSTRKSKRPFQVNFEDCDTTHIKYLHDDPLIIMLKVGQDYLHTLLIDTGSATYVLFRRAIEVLGLTQMDLWEREVTSKVKAQNNEEKKTTFVDLLQPKSTNLSLLLVLTMGGDFPSIKIPEAGIWGGGPWHIEGQLLRVTIWTPEFDINKQKNTHAMVWVKFPGLGTEYWEEDVLMSMARAVQNPVQVDSSTLCRNTRFYTSVLVDVDFSKPDPTKIMVEREGFEFCQEIQLGRTPKIYSHCKVVGHLVSECRDVVKEIEQEKVVQNEADTEPKKKIRNRKKPAKNE
ncbi:hypothetical protein GIB67_008975 [Kingdonia uniflora]|uniref:DUF4283 domain-containing protein n=1 Tax=Kingdonia uniflora TaxID=39325 RepID=A0A7J7LVT6_9MAGN|nr:hypothetical protein GIB67_008975 [Kingdonia uniflora]